MPQGTLSVSPVGADRDADAAGIISSVVRNVEALMPVSAAMRAKLGRVREILGGGDGKPN
jgi:hypothetical protein